MHSDTRKNACQASGWRCNFAIKHHRMKPLACEQMLSLYRTVSHHITLCWRSVIKLSWLRVSGTSKVLQSTIVVLVVCTWHLMPQFSQELLIAVSRDNSKGAVL